MPCEAYGNSQWLGSRCGINYGAGTFFVKHLTCTPSFLQGIFEAMRVGAVLRNGVDRGSPCRFGSRPKVCYPKGDNAGVLIAEQARELVDAIEYLDVYLDAAEIREAKKGRAEPIALTFDGRAHWHRRAPNAWQPSWLCGPIQQHQHSFSLEFLGGIRRSDFLETDFEPTTVSFDLFEETTSWN